MTMNDGGPAFPHDFETPPAPDLTVTRRFGTGMSLRDYLAAHAPDMPDWWRYEWLRSEGLQPADITYEREFQLFAIWRYDYADVMLSTRATVAPQQTRAARRLGNAAFAEKAQD